MKLKLSFVLFITTIFSGAISGFAQTTGNLTFVFTQVPHTSYSGSRNVMAVWIQTSTGTFVKTRVRNVGSGTKDHLATWAVNSGGVGSNALGTGSNVVGATTGATLTSFGTRTVMWDGKDVNGNVVADGTYKITIQSTWNHGGGGGVSTSYTFTKGATSDIQTPADDANFTNVSLQWIPSAAEITENPVLPNFNIYPNPSTDGQFTMDYTNGNTIRVFDLQGKMILEQELEVENGSLELDLSAQENGNYIIHLVHGDEIISSAISINK